MVEGGYAGNVGMHTFLSEAPPRARLHVEGSLAMSLFIILLFIALMLTVAEATGKCPGWAPKFVIIVALLVQFWGK